MLIKALIKHYTRQARVPSSSLPAAGSQMQMEATDS